MSEFLSLTEIGRLYGVSSHQVGKWLKETKLRTQDGKPSHTAFDWGLVTTRPSRGFATYYYVWDADKVTGIIDAAGHERAGTTAR
ncbi:hypothetical protein R5W23_005553 [Gemmata sp. JC673]|uniref:Uncharacterized protein n=1 Tax=Gemmata algarum TaxID=2975278 RepID=A0ABU5ESX7_9BACT|nr:hypothetical protein [Gemmata algarum]MDY3558438.1 hypothetical protein [Gemmata algarum]